MQTQSGCGGGAHEAGTGREIAVGDDAFGRVFVDGKNDSQTMPQERYNADWVTENELGLVLGSFGGIVKGVETMLEAGTLGRFQSNARKMNNRAIFEIPEIIDKLLQ